MRNNRASNPEVPADYWLHKRILLHFSSPDDADRMLNAETLNQPCVRLLFQLAELPAANSDSPDNALLRAILTTSTITRTKAK